MKVVRRRGDTPMHEPEKIKQELDELRQTFELIYAADRRAIEQWRAESPKDRDLVIPDRTKLVIWLLEKLEAARRGVLEALLCEKHMWLKTNITAACPQCSIDQAYQNGTKKGAA